MTLSAAEIAHTRKMTYLNFAIRAAKLEQAGQLADAAQAWQTANGKRQTANGKRQTAKNQAYTKADQAWCEYRKNFCHQWKGKTNG